MTTEDYLDKALKYAQERYDERHYEDTSNKHADSDWGEDYRPWIELIRGTRYDYLTSSASARNGDRDELEAFLANPLHKMVIEAAKILVEEKGL